MEACCLNTQLLNVHNAGVCVGNLQGVFLAVTISSLAGAAAIFGAILVYARWKNILLIPSGPSDVAVLKS